MISFNEYNNLNISREKASLIMEKLVDNLFASTIKQPSQFSSITQRIASLPPPGQDPYSQKIKTINYPDTQKLPTSVPNNTYDRTNKIFKYPFDRRVPAPKGNTGSTSIVGPETEVVPDFKLKRAHEIDINSQAAKDMVLNLENSVKRIKKELESKVSFSLANLAKITNVSLGMPVQKAVQLVLKASDDLEEIDNKIINSAKYQMGLARFKHSRF